VSVDAGKSWGPLAKLTVRGADGAPRPAQGSDVTHLRWKLGKPVARRRDGLGQLPRRPRITVVSRATRSSRSSRR
jgi:hypothetical protein